MGHGLVSRERGADAGIGRAPTSSAAAAAASAFVRSCGSARRMSSIDAIARPSGRDEPRRRRRETCPRRRVDRDADSACRAPASRRASRVGSSRRTRGGRRPAGARRSAPWRRRSASKVPCQSRWSSASASSTATRGRNVSANASWNDDTSATSTSASSSTASSSVRPMFPAATARRPDASSIAAVRLVTVVFPFVPVTATIGAAARSAARSISLRTATPARACGDDRRMRFGDQRARHDELDLADRRAVPVVRRARRRRARQRRDAPRRASGRRRRRGGRRRRSRPSPRGAGAARPLRPSPRGRSRARASLESRTGGSRRRRCRRRARRRSPENSQNRTITVNSDQPPTSKWWWIGAMRSTRRRKPRYEMTCAITDSASSSGRPARIGSSSCVRAEQREAGHRAADARATRCRP